MVAGRNTEDLFKAKLVSIERGVCRTPCTAIFLYALYVPRLTAVLAEVGGVGGFASIGNEGGGLIRVAPAPLSRELMLKGTTRKKKKNEGKHEKG